jgi:hypothetical protein
MTHSRLSALLPILLLPLLACGPSSGQGTTADAAAAETGAESEGERPARTARVRSLAAGTQIGVTLLDSLDSESAKAGDRFSAQVSSPVTDGAYVLLPAGSRVTGRLTDVRPTRGDDAAVIVVAFDSVQVGEKTLPMAATVTDVQMASRSEMKDEGKKIGIGAAAGAVIGAVVGKDVKGAIIGAASGAAVGTAIALGTQARYAVLPAGSKVTLRLDEPLAVRLP